MAQNFSIIIPHKNIPDLLQRCLDSIPVREDIQVIVIDDNSSLDIVDFEHFPMWKGLHYEYYLTKEGKGAGYARNVGLSKAKGDWILFADSDDFFSPGIENILNSIICKREDVIYFCHRSVMSDNPSALTSRCEELNQFIIEYLDNRNEKNLRYHFDSPWCKIIRRSLIANYKIKFHETRWANDAYFSAQVGCFAKSISALNIDGYTTTIRTGSLAYSFCGTYKETIVRLNEAIKIDKLYKHFGVQQSVTKTYGFLSYLYVERGFIWMSSCCLSSFCKPNVFFQLSHYLTKRLFKKIRG